MMRYASEDGVGYHVEGFVPANLIVIVPLCSEAL